MAMTMGDPTGTAKSDSRRQIQIDSFPRLSEFGLIGTWWANGDRMPFSPPSALPFIHRIFSVKSQAADMEQALSEHSSKC
ncbi:hypothetical protein PAAG_01837 [Paracoccidioides lutzii Pb01]|uniref:Uncharacterized protein n=1 Tax=Paracoccidioides lutzii (strain ATCC MYA-826 / Pb01) TaxID=502779 RepID=C1GTJ2_PARBA|nr:hypothetical protein PAAG_01837 [Paracoccidioides lutzii Pb01]EEH39648.2 hypothetical protein PAAG_01837 [Paracoccidioides lutzii Pb01]